MDFEVNILKISDRFNTIKTSIKTEEATKTSLVLPFLNLLGYDIFDPTVIVPEFTADIGRKKGEKVDYAVMINNKPLILIEVKQCNEKLDRHKTQLERYFTVTESKFAILTNGFEYRFYSDLDKPNVMDIRPFLSINLLNIAQKDIKELEKFRFEKFDIDNILSMAGDKRNIRQIKEIFKNEITNPSDEFVKFFASKITNKPLRQNIIGEFHEYTKKALTEFINENISKKINSLSEKLIEESEEQGEDEIQEQKTKDKRQIVTTQEELEGFYIVKSILADTIELKRIAQRDTLSYFGILLDDNNRKWIARLYFNYSNKYIEIRTGEKSSEKYLLNKIEDIYLYKEKLHEAINIVNQ